ncbi:MAG: phosphoribosyltransferase, partial [Candidatus Heimdallarchaeota archaeon]|nr:phosphoribosyltransferase [Candidatus Heimdallarchaeota archaeon]
EEINYELVNKKILLVDDVSDSGRSLDFAIKHLSKFNYLEMKTATIHYKPKSIFKPDFFISETDKWIVYPWEYMEFTKLYIAKRKSEGISEDIIKEQLLSLSIPALILKELL